MLAVVLACFAAGVALRRRLPRAVGWLAPLDRMVLWVALPALILARLPGADLASTVVVPVIVAWAMVATAVAVISTVGRRLQWDRSVVGTLLLVTALGNTSFLGLPAVEALLGRDHLSAALAYDQLGTFLALATFGSVVASRYGVAERGWRPVVLRLLTFPPFLALLATLPLRAWPLGEGTTEALGSIGRLVGPLAMLALGLRFRVELTAQARRPAVWCLSTKLVLLPALVLGAAVAVGATSQIPWRAAVLESGMPPMVTAAVVAAQAGLDEQLAAFVVGAGLLLSLLTLPLLRIALG